MPNQTTRSTQKSNHGRRRFLLATLLAVTLLAAGATFSQATGPSYPGPWDMVTDVRGCAEQGRVCAEWPIMQTLSFVCCIKPNDVGRMTPPSTACGGDVGFLRAK